MNNPLQGLSLVFTGKMSKTRDQMETEALLLGADVEKAVRTYTDYVVVGARPGKKKIAAAKAGSCHMINEDEYRKLITDRKQAAEKEGNQPATPPASTPEVAGQAVDRAWLENVRRAPAKIGF